MLLSYKGGLPNLKKGNSRYDQALLIDVFEHVEGQKITKEINRIMKAGGCLLLSVPTPEYPRYFGDRFANSVGHVRDGYTIDDMKHLLNSSGFDVIQWKYPTNWLASKLSSVWYQSKLPTRLLFVITPLAILLSLVHPYTPKKHSCNFSLLAMKK